MKSALNRVREFNRTLSFSRSPRLLINLSMDEIRLNELKKKFMSSTRTDLFTLTDVPPLHIRKYLRM